LVTQHTRLIRPTAVAAACLGGLALLLSLRADGKLHVHALDVAPGEAILVRVPSGRTVLLAGGRLNAHALAAEVADNLAVWEHGLGVVVALDSAAETRLRLTLERYPAEQLVDAHSIERLDLGGGAVLDLYPGPSAAVSFGQEWVRLIGDPPAPDGTEPGLRSARTTSAATPAE
jgi:hypothetical protein